MSDAANTTKTTESKPVVIKKYANRRLYDTGTSAYITLEDLCARVKEGKDFVVVDAKSGQDLTRQVLTQIILEQEGKGFNILPTKFLRDAIQHYDTNMQGVMQGYLETSMKGFVDNQERIQSLFTKSMQGMDTIAPLNQFEEITRQNMAMFEQTVNMFNPFSSAFGTKDDETPADKKQKAE